MAPVRMDVRRLSIIFLLSTAAPLFLGLLAVVLFDVSVTLLLWVGVMTIPLAAFTVGRAVLAEMDRVIQEVAPDEPDDESKLSADLLVH